MTPEEQAKEAQLDEWLAAHKVEIAPGDPLVARIVAGAPRRQAARWRWLWPGAGLAGIGLAGSIAGAFAVSVTLGAGSPRSMPDWPERLTAFTESSPDWSEE